MNKPTDTNFENAKSGDTIVSMLPDGKGGIKYESTHILKEFNATTNRWSYATCIKPDVVYGSIPAEGCGYFFMSKRLHPDYWYSANPAHVQDALDYFKKKKQAYQELKAELERRAALASPISTILLDDTDDSDKLSNFSHYLAQLFTDDQLRTMRGWLSIE